MIGDLPTNTKRDREASAGALPQGEGWSRATVSSRDSSLTWPSAVCLAVKPAGEPDARNPHVRFDERGGETGLRQAGLRRSPRKRRPLPPEAYRHRAPPRLYFSASYRRQNPSRYDELIRPFTVDELMLDRLPRKPCREYPRTEAEPTGFQALCRD